MNTLFEFVRFNTQDGYELCGMFSKEGDGSNRAIVHLHGLAGNFYEQRFLDYLVDVGMATGRRILLFNNRGHDYFSDAYVEAGGGRTTVSKGGAHERIEEAKYDIEAAIKLVRDEGINDVILTSHSTGCVKAARFMMDENADRSLITGLVLLSPSDDVSIQADNSGEDFERTLKEAAQMIEGGRGEELMPEGTFFYPLDAQAYQELFDPDGPGNVFDFNDYGGGLAPLNSISVPVIVVLGSEDIAVVGPDKQRAADAIIDALPSNSRHRAVVIDGAGHDYSGHENELQHVLEDWLKSI